MLCCRKIIEEVPFLIITEYTSFGRTTFWELFLEKKVRLFHALYIHCVIVLCILGKRYLLKKKVMMGSTGNMFQIAGTLQREQ